MSLQVDTQAAKQTLHPDVTIAELRQKLDRIGYPEAVPEVAREASGDARS